MVFGVGGASTTARAMAFVRGRRRMDDDFCAAGIRSRMFALGLAESGGFGAATAADVDWSVRGGGDQWGAAVLQRTRNCIACAVLNGRESCVRVSAEFESDGDVVQAATWDRAGDVSRRTYFRFGDTPFVERARRARLARGDCWDVRTDIDWWLSGGVWHDGRAFSVSASGVRSSADFCIVCQSRSAPGNARIFRAHVGAVCNVDLVRCVLCGCTACARCRGISKRCGVWCVCGNWIGCGWLLGRGVACGPLGPNANDGVSDDFIGRVRVGDWMERVAGR